MAHQAHILRNVLTLNEFCHIFSRHSTSASADDLNTSLRCVNNVIFLGGGFFGFLKTDSCQAGIFFVFVFFHFI